MNRIDIASIKKYRTGDKCKFEDIIRGELFIAEYGFGEVLCCKIQVASAINEIGDAALNLSHNSLADIIVVAKDAIVEIVNRSIYSLFNPVYISPPSSLEAKLAENDDARVWHEGKMQNRIINKRRAHNQ